MSQSPISIGILLFNQVELLDFAGPYEVFCMANAITTKDGMQKDPFSVLTVAENEGWIVTRGGLKVIPDSTLRTCPSLNTLLVPGGPGVRQEVQNQVIVDWITNKAQECRQVASVCTGALLLGKAGLLTNRQVTTHWAALDELAELCPDSIVLREYRVVDSGEIVTAAGVSAGIDLALYLTARYCGEETRQRVARQMEYIPISGNLFHAPSKFIGSE